MKLHNVRTNEATSALGREATQARVLETVDAAIESLKKGDSLAAIANVCILSEHFSRPISASSSDKLFGICSKDLNAIHTLLCSSSSVIHQGLWEEKRPLAEVVLALQGIRDTLSASIDNLILPDIERPAKSASEYTMKFDGIILALAEFGSREVLVRGFPDSPEKLSIVINEKGTDNVVGVYRAVVPHALGRIFLAATGDALILVSNQGFADPRTGVWVLPFDSQAQAGFSHEIVPIKISSEICHDLAITASARKIALFELPFPAHKFVGVISDFEIDFVTGSVRIVDSYGNLVPIKGYNGMKYSADQLLLKKPSPSALHNPHFGSN